MWDRENGQTIDKNRPKTIVWHTTRARVIYCNINTIIGGGGSGPTTGHKN
jgi:ABC-type transporter Mla maintaining outer membrane lipid asymmetry ATPase subunit MlaF